MATWEEDGESSPSPQRYRATAASSGILLATSGPYADRIFQVRCVPRL